MKFSSSIFIAVIVIAAFVTAGGFMVHGAHETCPLSSLGEGNCVNTATPFTFAVSHLGMMLRVSSAIAAVPFLIILIFSFFIRIIVFTDERSTIAILNFRETGFVAIPHQERKITRWLSFHENSPSPA